MNGKPIVLSADEFLKRHPGQGRECVLSRYDRRLFFMKNILVLGQPPLLCPLDSSGRPRYVLQESSNYPLSESELLGAEQIGAMGVPDEHPECALLYQWRSTNFWHWMAELVANLVLLREIGFSGKLVIPPNPPGFIRQTLDLLDVDPKRVVAFHRPSIVRSLLALDQFPLMDMWSDDGPLPRRTMNKTLFERIRAAFLGGDGYRDARPGLRLYIRRTGTRRVANEPQLLRLIEAHGFRAIVPETMSLREQIDTVAEAEALIAPCGAGSVLAMFMPRQTHYIELFSPSCICNPMLFSSRHLQQSYHMILNRFTFSGNNLVNYNDNIIANIELLEYTLANLFEEKNEFHEQRRYEQNITQFL